VLTLQPHAQSKALSERTSSLGRSVLADPVERHIAGMRTDSAALLTAMRAAVEAGGVPTAPTRCAPCGC